MCGWGWVNAGKVAKPLTVGFCPSAKVALCTFCTTVYDRLATGWLALAQVESGLGELPTAARHSNSAFTVKKKEVAGGHGAGSSS